jgi:hypothetical protein
LNKQKTNNSLTYCLFLYLLKEEELEVLLYNNINDKIEMKNSLYNYSSSIFQSGFNIIKIASNIIKLNKFNKINKITENKEIGINQLEYYF